MATLQQQTASNLEAEEEIYYPDSAHAKRDSPQAEHDSITQQLLEQQEENRLLREKLRALGLE
jgi:hypothetical protein